MFLQAYEEQAALRWQDWLRLVAVLDKTAAMAEVAEVDLPHFVALVVHGHPVIDARTLRARALSLQLLAAKPSRAGRALQDPEAVARALRAIADTVCASWS